MLHSTQMYIPLKPLFSRHKGIGVQFTDEPTGALDSQNSAMLMKTFVQMNEQMHATILMVTHDASMAAYAGRVLFLKDGRIWKEQIKNGQSNQAFYEVILKSMTLLGGGADAC